MCLKILNQNVLEYGTSDIHTVPASYYNNHVTHLTKV